MKTSLHQKPTDCAKVGGDARSRQTNGRRSASARNTSRPTHGASIQSNSRSGRKPADNREVACRLTEHLNLSPLKRKDPWYRPTPSA